MKFPTGGIVRKPKGMTRCNSVTDGTVRMAEDREHIRMGSNAFVRTGSVMLDGLFVLPSGIRAIPERENIMNDITIKKQKKAALNVRTLSVTAMLAAISYILAFVEIPVPLSPSFARFDLSDFPALIGSFAFGPTVGVLIELMKNALQLISTSTGGVGELANFIMGASFVFSSGIIYKLNKTKKTVCLSLIIGSVVMGIVAAITNYFILLPLFESFMPLDELIKSFEYFIPFIKTKLDIVLYNTLPFNVLKGLAIGVVTMPVYKKLAPILNGKSEERR